MNIKYNH